MSVMVCGVVLLAGFLHAVWNAPVKGGADTTGAMGAVAPRQGVAGAAPLPFAALPTAESPPCLALGAGLHRGCQLVLVLVLFCRLGDLTPVYPIAREVAPPLVAPGSMQFLGTRFSPGESAALLMISLGIAATGLVRRDGGVMQGKAALLALVTGRFIAACSLVDATGARRAGVILLRLSRN